MDRNQEYIKHLQERNRIKRSLAEKSEDELAKEELERGFSTHFRGPHAPSKETITSTKPHAIKPQIKLHGKATNHDIIQRLLPPGFNDAANVSPQQRGLRSRGEHRAEPIPFDQPLLLTARSNDSRDSSTNGVDKTPRNNELNNNTDVSNITFESRSQNQQFNGKLVANLYEKDQSETELISSRSDTCPIEEGNRTNIPINLMQSADLNELLIGKIKGLTIDQKFAMIQLLQQTNLPPSVDCQKTAFAIQELPASTERDELCGPSEAQKCDDRSIEKLRTENSGNNNDLPNIHLNIKIKIYSTWGNAKHVIMQGIRLRYNVDKLYFDVLHGLNLKVQSGLSKFQSSTEVMRTMPFLIGQATRPNNAMWRAPISSESPIELIFEGALPQNIISAMLCGSQFDFSRFDMLIWNGFQDESMANSSPAKDVDIFFDNKCIWSGECVPENRISEISRAIDTTTSSSKLESAPSLKLKLVQPSRLSSSVCGKSSGDIGGVGKGSTIISPYRKTVGNSQREELEKAVVSSSSLQSSPVKSKKAENPTVNDIPDWLRGSKGLERKFSVLDSPMRTSGKEEGEFEKREKEFGAFSQTVEHSPSGVSRSATKSRRRRPREVVGHQGGGSSPKSSSSAKSFIQYINPTDRQESDTTLRRSMEAVEHAEKFNLNRLESTLSKRKSQAELVTIEESLNTNLNGADQATTLLSSRTSASVNISKILESSQPEKFQVAPTVHCDVSSSSKAATKIDDVNTKLNNALTDLAEIMASLPRNRSERRFQPLPLNDSPAFIDASTPQPKVVLPTSISPTAIRMIDEHPMLDSPDVATSNEMPCGKVLTLQIYSTYGDMNYVGLNGIEIYDEESRLLSLNNKIASIVAQPPDLSILPGYEDDPRKVINLLDGVNTTKDDLHQWLAPHLNVARENLPQLKLHMVPDNTEELVASITIEFSSLQFISMIRIFNFNKSRTHNQRGVKSCRLYLDDTLIFQGDIKRASGQMKICEADIHSISFTKDDRIIQCAPSPFEKSKADDDALEESISSPNARPKTAIKHSAETGLPTDSSSTKSVLTESPATSPTSSFLNEILSEVENIDKFTKNLVSNPTNRVDVREGDSFRDFHDGEGYDRYNPKNVPSIGENDIIYFKHAIDKTAEMPKSIPTTVMSVISRSVRIEFDSTWGDRDHVGLCGLEVIGIDGKPIPIYARNLSFESSSDIFGTSGIGDRKVDNILNGINNTANNEFMWLASFPFEKKKQFLEIKFPTEKIIIGLRFWNYNGTFDATLRGVRHCTIFFDDRPTLKFLLRPAPECDGVDFSQTLLFDQYFFDQEEQRRKGPCVTPFLSSYMSPKLKQIYEVVAPPTGLLWKFTFFNNHGDDYYIGLDAIDMYDTDNQIVNVSRKGGHITAVPHSVRDLASSDVDPLNKDPRTPEKLFSRSFCHHSAGKSCWLAPLAKCMTEGEREACVVRSLSFSNSVDQSEYYKKKKPSNLFKENVVMVMLSYPVSIAAIRFFNYSKSVRRGVKDFSIHVDGKLVFLGSLQRADEETKRLPDARSVAQQGGNEFKTCGQAVVFSQEMKVINAHKDYISPAGLLDQDVLCINERQVMVRSKTMYEPPNSSSIVLENPNTDFIKRPTTSFLS